MAIPQHLAELPIPPALVEELRTLVDRPIRVMVVCGTQTRTLLKYSESDILPEDLEIIAGPGCSICVMPAGHIDAFVKIGKEPGVITATCEDLLRVQGSRESLSSIRTQGALVEVVDAPMEALDLARKHPDKIVVFTAVGFEGAAPDVAEAILEAASEGIDNFCVIPSIRLLPPSLDNLMGDPDLNIRGLLCSAHIQSITDSQAYADLARQHHLSCAVTGFGIVEILEGLISIVKQIRSGEPNKVNPFNGIDQSDPFRSPLCSGNGLARAWQHRGKRFRDQGRTVAVRCRQTLQRQVPERAGGAPLPVFRYSLGPQHPPSMPVLRRHLHRQAPDRALHGRPGGHLRLLFPAHVRQTIA